MLANFLYETEEKSVLLLRIIASGQCIREKQGENRSNN